MEAAWKFKNPNQMGLITTYRCNAECPECCFGCVADKGRTMTLEEMKSHVDKCLEAFPEIYVLSISGGECFLLGKDLDGIISYAKSRGLQVNLVTNGYWGHSYEYAVKRVQELARAGLYRMAFSCGSNHQSHFPHRNVRNAIVAAARGGLYPSVRMETHWGRTPSFEKFRDDAAFMRLVKMKKITLEEWEWQGFNNKVIHYRCPPTRHEIYGEYKGCQNIFSWVIILPHGDVLPCCGIGAPRIPFLRLGNINREPLKEVYRRGFYDAIKVWIWLKGAEDILKFVYENSNIRVHNIYGACMACREVFSHPKILPFLRETYNDWIKNVR